MGWLWNSKPSKLVSFVDRKKEEGIVIVSHFICEECESEMIRTEAEDAKYRFFIGRMKKIGLQINA